MTVQLDSTSGGVQNYGGSLTHPHTVTGSDAYLIVAGAVSTSTDKVTGVTYNGQAMTRLRADSVGGGVSVVSYVYGLAIANGDGQPHNVVWTFATPDVGMNAVSASFTGVKTADPIAAQGGASSSFLSSPASLNVATPAGGMAFYHLAVNDNALTLTPGAGQTAIGAQTTAVPHANSASYKAGATAMSASWAGGAQKVGAHSVIALNPLTAPADTQAPTLSSPTGAASGTTTATGTVTTDEANGTLYWLASTNVTETAATVKGGSSRTVTATGAQSVTVSGLTASTSYYLHYLHRDAAGNDSAVANSAQFTTSAAGDTTPPTLSSPTGTATGTTTATGTVSTNEANGSLYYYASTNATETAATVKASGAFQSVTATGGQNVSLTGLSPSTAYYLHYLHRDAAGNDSAVANSAAFTTSAPAVGTINVQNIRSTTTIRASVSGLTVTVLDHAGFAFVKKFTNQATDASGNLALSDALLVAGTAYAVVIRDAAGVVGVEKYTAA